MSLTVGVPFTSGVCPPLLGYPPFCPRDEDPPELSVCCRLQGSPGCCHSDVTKVCSYRFLPDGSRDNMEFDYGKEQYLIKYNKFRIIKYI